MTDEKTLTVAGHCDVDPERIYGPDAKGVRYRAESARYRPDTDATVFTLRPMTESELMTLVDIHRERTWQMIDERQSIAALFGGNP